MCELASPYVSSSLLTPEHSSGTECFRALSPVIVCIFVLSHSEILLKKHVGPFALIAADIYHHSDTRRGRVQFMFSVWACLLCVCVYPVQRMTWIWI